MSAAKRMQFNIDLMPIPEVEVMNNLPEMVFPLFWVEEGADLNKTFVNMLKYQLFLLVLQNNSRSKTNLFFSGSGLKFRATVKWLTLIIGPIGAVTALFLEYQRRHASSLEVQKITPDKDAKKAVDEALSSAVTQELNEKERY